MPGTVNPAPPGLLSLLELKQQGENPNRLSDTVVPVVDLTHWYGQDRLESVAGYQFLGDGIFYSDVIPFITQPLTVPEGEVWWVDHYSVLLFFDTAPATTLLAYHQLAPVVIPRNIPLPLATFGANYLVGESAPAFSSVVAGAVPASGGYVTSPALRDFWAGPGTTFGYAFAGIVTAGGAGGQYIAGAPQFTRLKV